VGLLQNDEGSSDGFTLFCLDGSLRPTYLIDNNGMLVHQWKSNYKPLSSLYLLENGSLLRTANYAGGYPDDGGFQVMDWDGDVVWEYHYQYQHHDIEPLPNGNVLLISEDIKTYQEAIDAGRDPVLLAESTLDSLKIVEVAKTGTYSGTVVWEWHVWDHLIQDFDAGKDNYGVVADHPELMDINFVFNGDADWLHTNSVEYNPDLDQIVLSHRRICETWIIDHSTTTAEAASHSGGNSGHGGDILYRWGNPQVYDAGDESDKQSFAQHDSQWIKLGLPGAGNILFFNNGGTRWGRDDDYSTVDEIVTPVDTFGNYSGTPGVAYAPAAPVWTYKAGTPADFYSPRYSGAQRLPNGNTLICDGVNGTLFEVTVEGKMVWKYVNPVIQTGPLTQGDTVPTGYNDVFRCVRYVPDYTGLAGRDLTPIGPIENYDASTNLTLQSTVGGMVTNRGEGTFSYGVGQLVTIVAEASPCYEFVNWTVESGSVSLANPGSPHATFTMGSQNSVVQANFNYNCVNVDIYVNLQGANRPSSGWEVPLNVEFFEPEADVLSATPVYSFTGTTTMIVTSGTRAMLTVGPVNPGTYDITADSITTLLNVKRNVGIW